MLNSLHGKKRLFDPQALEHFPKEPGVYLMKDASGKVLYIGKAKHLKTRLKQYFAMRGDERLMVPFLIKQIATIETVVVPNEKEALLLENTLIKKHQPKYNALLKDDKTFISLMINHKHPWPMVRVVRCQGRPKDDALYFGPYTNAYAARQTLELLSRIFPLRQCSDDELKRRKRPCLLYAIKRCVAPCVQLCSKEEYTTFVQGAIQFLKGENRGILKELEQQMQAASAALEFEKAASLLQTIQQIEHVTAKAPLVAHLLTKDTDVFGLLRQANNVMLVQLLFREGNLVGSEHYFFTTSAEEDEDLLTSFILQNYLKNPNLPKEILVPFSLSQENILSEILSKNHKVEVFFPRQGEKKKLLELAEKNAKVLFEQTLHHQEEKEKLLLELQEVLHLTRYPRHIECFDTSNISGTDLVASMIAFIDGEKEKKRVRTFHIRGINKGDDYAALHQVLSRRLSRAKEEQDLPDLVIVDGGKGQLNIALDVFKELDIASVDLIALAKEEGRHDKGMTAETVHLPHHPPISLPPHSALLFFLQKIRDEAHTKAITFHRKQRQKRTLTSALDSLSGIGPVKRKKLLAHFGSIKRIKEASVDELKAVKGLSEKDIATLQNL